MEIIRAEHVSKEFGCTFRLGPLDLRVAPGEILGIVGPEGSGKTTLLKLLWGFIRPDDGRISIFGMEPHLNQLRLRHRVGYLGPNPRFHSEWTAKQFAQYLGHFYSGWNEMETSRLLSYFAIDPNSKIRDLSSGDRSKVAIVSVTSHRPELLLLDEPISSIDRASRRAILRFLSRLAKERHISILLSCSLSDDLDYIADSVLMLKDGRAVEYASGLRES